MDCFDRLREKGFDVVSTRHAEAILSFDFPEASHQLAEALLSIEIPAYEIVDSGGGETKGTQRLRASLAGNGWPKHNFRNVRFVDDIEMESITHEIDHVFTSHNGFKIAAEIEWNNKNTFFDRDLFNFHRLHSDGVISVAVMITRGSSLDKSALVDVVRSSLSYHSVGNFMEFENAFPGAKKRTERQIADVNRAVDRGVDFRSAFAKQFVSDKYASTTTSWVKLEELIALGGGTTFPLLRIGIPRAVISEVYSAATDEL